MRIVLLALFLFLSALRPAAAGMVTMVFDDGLIGVYKYSFPVLQRLGLPAVTAVIVGQMESDNDDYMRTEQVRELQDAGWEVASHGYSHRRISDIPVFYTDEARPVWRKDGTTPEMVQAYYWYSQVACVMEGDTELQLTADLDDAAAERGSYYFDRITGELHVNPLPRNGAGQPALRVCSYEREMDLSRRRLAALGFDVSTYVVPYNYFTLDVEALGKKYYSYMALGYEGDGVNHTLNPYHIIRSGVHNGEAAEDLIEQVKKQVQGKNAWLVLCMHDVGSGLGWEPWSAIELEKFATWLKKNHMAVVTIREGAARMRQRQEQKKKQ